MSDRCAMISHMSIQTAVGHIPELTLGWRLQMALGHANLTVQEMADELGMSRGSLSRWLNDRGAPPRPVFIKAWALRTGVPAEWLLTGHAENPRPGDPDGGEDLTAAERAREDSNLQPSDPKVDAPRERRVPAAPVELPAVVG